MRSPGVLVHAVSLSHLPLSRERHPTTGGQVGGANSAAQNGQEENTRHLASPVPFACICGRRKP